MLIPGITNAAQEKFKFQGYKPVDCALHAKETDKRKKYGLSAEAANFKFSPPLILEVVGRMGDAFFRLDYKSVLQKVSSETEVPVPSRARPFVLVRWLCRVRFLGRS